MAREKWRSDWYDRFAGPVYLRCPRLSGVPRELAVMIISRWGAAFAIVEFRPRDAHYQFSRRPHRGENRWARLNSTRRIMDEPDDAPNNAPSIDSRPPHGR